MLVWLSGGSERVSSAGSLGSPRPSGLLIVTAAALAARLMVCGDGAECGWVGGLLVCLSPKM